MRHRNKVQKLGRNASHRKAMMKNMALGNLLIRLPLRIPLDGVAFLLELLKGHFANALAILKAYGWVLTHLPLIWRQRRRSQQKRRCSDGRIFSRMYPGSLVFEYFILGKRKFSELLFVDKLLKSQR